MSMYLGPFYIRDSDFFFLLATLLSLVVIIFSVDLSFIEPTTLILLTIIFLVARGLLPSFQPGNLYLLFITALFVSIFVPVAIVLIYLAISAILLRITKQL